MYNRRHFVKLFWSQKQPIFLDFSSLVIPMTWVYDKLERSLQPHDITIRMSIPRSSPIFCSRRPIGDKTFRVLFCILCELLFSLQKGRLQVPETRSLLPRSITS